MPRPDDESLVDRLLARDESALREVIELHGSPVLGIARTVLADAALAEEVAQDTFLALWRRPGAFDPSKGRLQAFLVGIARKKAIDVVRREEAAKRAKEPLIAEVMGSNKADAHEHPMENVDERRDVVEALRELTDVQKEAVVLAYFGGRTYREVAAELGIPEGTAKTRLRDGLVKLRRIMRSKGRHRP